MAGNKRCFVGYEKEHSVGNLFGPSHTQQRLVAAAHFFPLLVGHALAKRCPWRESSKPWRLDGAGANTVYSNANRTVIQRHFPLQIHDRLFGSAIAGVLRRS